MKWCWVECASHQCLLWSARLTSTDNPVLHGLFRTSTNCQQTKTLELLSRRSLFLLVEVIETLLTLYRESRDTLNIKEERTLHHTTSQQIAQHTRHARTHAQRCLCAPVGSLRSPAGVIHHPRVIRAHRGAHERARSASGTK